jgi:hypothetical protein
MAGKPASIDFRQLVIKLAKQIFRRLHAIQHGSATIVSPRTAGGLAEEMMNEPVCILFSSMTANVIGGERRTVRARYPPARLPRLAA